MSPDFNPRAQAPNSWAIVFWGVFLVLYLQVLFLFISGTLRSISCGPCTQPSLPRTAPSTPNKIRRLSLGLSPGPQETQGQLAFRALRRLANGCRGLWGESSPSSLSDLSSCYGLEKDMNGGTLSGLVSLAVTGAEAAESPGSPCCLFPCLCLELHPEVELS